MIVAVAVRFGDAVLSMPPPARHHHVLQVADGLGLDALVSPEDQGFLTSSGSYVGREKALRIALDAGQLREDTARSGGYAGEELFSEDLW